MATAAEVPVGATFIDTLEVSFVDVRDNATANNGAIETTTFLEATESLMALFDILGPIAFKVVKDDMKGNIKKIRARFIKPDVKVATQEVTREEARQAAREAAAKADCKTLQALVDNELKTKKHTSTEGLVWLVRGLEFTQKALQNNVDDENNKELKKSFEDAYGETLGLIHGFFAKAAFYTAMTAVPYRKDFYAKLSSDYEQLKPKLKEWLEALGEIVEILKTFLNPIATKLKI